MPTDPPTLTSFTAGDLVISISGDGDGSGTYTDNQATPLTLDEITTTGSIVAQLVLPQTTAVVNGITEYAISAEYGSSSEGQLQLSSDGQSLTIGGYGVNAVTYNTGGAAVYGDARLAQSTSVMGGSFTPVARVVADIRFDASVDTSTALYDFADTNNIRSVATVNGTSFYVSGQGVKGDTTQGFFTAADGADEPTPIDASTDGRAVEIVDGQLYASRDSTQGTGGGTSNIASFGATLPTSATVPTPLPGIDGSLVLAAEQENSVNAGAVGTTIHLSPESFFFASATTLYVADSGNPKGGGIGDGGLQKWSFNGTSWVLDYTLSTGLNLVPDTVTSGTTGLIGLTGTVVGDTVDLFATNATVGDLDQTFVYGISDTLDATSLPGDESFTVLVTAPADTNIRGISFAPQAQSTAPSFTTVSAGQSSGGLGVTDGSSLTVLNGGTATDTTVFAGGSAVISSGGFDIGATIAHGGSETVLGSATGDQVEGTQIVSAATAAVSDETVYNGGAVDLFLKGVTASNVTLTNGGVLNISGNIIATDVTIDNGGTADLQSAKATLAGSFVFDGAGTLRESTVISAGFGVSAVISGFDADDVVDLTAFGPGATLSTSLVSGNTLATVSGGGATESFTFAGDLTSQLSLGSDNAGGSEIAFNAPPPVSVVVVPSGTAETGLIVSGGETLEVDAGGTIVTAQVLAGGFEIVSGTDSGTTISAGGNETILGTADGDQVFGTQLVSGATAVVSNETVYNGGFIDLFLKGGIVDAATVTSGGALNISGNATAEATVLMGGGTIDLQSPKANVTGSLLFSGPAAVLEETDLISAGFGVAAVISGFAPGDTIDLTVIGTGATLTSAVVADTTVETVSSGGISESFTFEGSYADGFFTLTPDLVGGVMINAQSPQAACYAAGTLIRTEQGETPIESLRPGDRVALAAGGFAPVVWTGHRRVHLRRHPRPHDVCPVRITAGAFADAMPRRDLLLSPDHGVLIDGVLIPVRYLVNGASIQQESPDHITYWHVELPAHGVILAEGLPAESYLDTGNRAAFEGQDAVALHPDFALRVWETQSCAPLVRAGAELEAARSLLLERAATRGWRFVADPDLHVLAAGRVLRPEIDGRIHRFVLPTATTGVIVRSRSAVPAETHEVHADARRLGVAVARLTLDGAPVDLTDARLDAGWHTQEGQGAWRWTGGAATLATGAARCLEIEIAMTARYWLAPAETRQRIA